MNKKAQATGMNWMLAFPILVILSLIFVAVILMLNTKQIILGPDTDKEIIIAQDSGSTIELQKNFNYFLHKKVIFNEKETIILELVENNELKDGEASDIFKKESQKIFSEILPFPIEEWPGLHPWWIRAYEKNKIAIPEDRETNPFFHTGSFICEPFTEKSITLIQYIEDKKIILCVSREYYKTLKEIESNE